VVLEAGVSGGRALEASRIENFPGFEDGIKGSELATRMSKQATRLGASIRTSEEVIGLGVVGEAKRATTRKRTYWASAVIICTGTQRKNCMFPARPNFLGEA
jgi:thioredoxin reductase (NADPH)